MNKQQFVEETKSHAKDVSRLINFAALEMQKRGRKHDSSKFDLADEYIEYLSIPKDERKKWVKGDGSAYDKHINAESHHIQKHQKGDEDLLDAIEMLADWVSASAQRDTILNPDETNIPDLDWKKICVNTLKLLVDNYGPNDSHKVLPKKPNEGGSEDA